MCSSDLNRPMHYVRTLGDVIEAAAPRTQGTSRVTPLPDASVYGSVPASAWKASLQDAGDGSQKGTWTGPVSGITLPVRVVLPADYRPDDGRTYNVIEGIHGWVGDPESLVSGIASPKRLQEAIDAGRIPPSIMVFPSVNVDGSQHETVADPIWQHPHRQHRVCRSRSEERRVGKECRSRWSPYH